MKILLSVLGWLALIPFGARSATLQLVASNRLDFARLNQTLELSAQQLAPLGASDLHAVHVTDATGKELLVQAVDNDFDTYHQPDSVIFQADFAARESKQFTISLGAKTEVARAQFKAFGRFNRERFDDFAWENDRIAHRTYGAALETWLGEPLASSTIDIWSKRTSELVINDWYLADDYHTDHGQGADYYSAGLSRGCGGNGLWAADRLWTSRNFVNSRVLANGPIRVIFELEYALFEVNGISVSEVKRVTLDAGSQLDHFQSSYRQFTRPGQMQKLVAGIGLKKVSGEQLVTDPAHGWFLSWEAVEKNAGHQGVAVIVAPESFEKQTEDTLNHLFLCRVGHKDVVSYWAGFCWDQAGQITNALAWQRYVDEFARGLESPIEVTVASGK